MDPIERMVRRTPELKSCAESVRLAYNALLACFRNGNKLLLCGNGGSCADCEHIAGELVKSFYRDRPLDTELAEKLGPELAANLHGSLPAIPLASFTTFILPSPTTRIPSMHLLSKWWVSGNPATCFSPLALPGIRQTFCMRRKQLMPWDCK